MHHTLYTQWYIINSQQRDSNSRPPVYETGAITAMLCWRDDYYTVTHTDAVINMSKRFGAAVARWAHNPKVRGSKPRIAIIYFFCLARNACAAIKKIKCETFSTYGSRVVPHLSTRQAQWCLTSEFGWDLVFPPWYDRMSMVRLRSHRVLSDTQYAQL